MQNLIPQPRPTGSEPALRQTSPSHCTYAQVSEALTRGQFPDWESLGLLVPGAQWARLVAVGKPPTLPLHLVGGWSRSAE